MLVEVASGNVPKGRGDTPTSLTALGSSCLIALSVARGEVEFILNAAASLIMAAPTLAGQYLKIPINQTVLQRSVQAVVLGQPSRNQWLNNGVPHQALVTSFPVDLPSTLSGAGELIVRSLVSDGCYIYIFTSKGLLKIGSGYGSSIRQHVYAYKQDFFSGERHGWLGYCKGKLYAKIGRKKNEVFELDKESLGVLNTVRLEAGRQPPLEQKCAVFTDGTELGLISVSNNQDLLNIRMYDVGSVPGRPESNAVTTLSPCKELNVNLMRRRTLAIGRASFEDLLSRRPLDLDAPVAMQLDDNEDDRLTSICAGQDFAILTTAYSI